MKALLLSADDFEDLELLYPYYRLKEDGWDVTVASHEEGTIRGKHGYPVHVDAKYSDIDPKGYDLLVLPGGRAPEKVRLHKEAIDIVKSFFRDDKYVAAICHGPQILASADELKGRKVTSWKGVKDDIYHAGANYVDAEVVVDGKLVTSRMPDDLPAFMREINKLTRELAKARGERLVA